VVDHALDDRAQLLDRCVRFFQGELSLHAPRRRLDDA